MLPQNIDIIPSLEWPRRRLICRLLSSDLVARHADRLISTTWAMLGAATIGLGSEGAKTYYAVFRGLATAIQREPDLVDDAAFAHAVEAWQFLERAGSDGEDDLIAAAQRYGAMSQIDRERLLKWARIWATADKP